MNPVSGEPGKFQGVWENFDVDGRYEVSFTVRDENNVSSTTSSEIFRKGDFPFIHSETDNLTYSDSEPMKVKLSLGGQGAFDVYIVLQYPDNSFHCLTMNESGFVFSNDDALTSGVFQTCSDIKDSFFDFQKNLLKYS